MLRMTVSAPSLWSVSVLSVLRLLPLALLVLLVPTKALGKSIGKLSQRPLASSVNLCFNIMNEPTLQDLIDLSESTELDEFLELDAELYGDDYADAVLRIIGSVCYTPLTNNY